MVREGFLERDSSCLMPLIIRERGLGLGFGGFLITALLYGEEIRLKVKWAVCLKSQRAGCSLRAREIIRTSQRSLS